MTLDEAVAYLQPIADSAVVGHYGEALDTVLTAVRAVSFPDQPVLARIIMQAYADATDGGDATYCGTPEDWYGEADAVRAALSTQPEAEPTDGIPEADATPDEAFELGRVSGYDEAMREIAQPAAGEATSRDERDSKFFHDGWLAALREIRLRGDRAVGEFLVEQLGEPEPAPELAELFPGTLAALDRLSIRPEVQS